MNTNVVNFVGIDVSKLTFDVGLIVGNDTQKISSFKYKNDVNGIEEFLKILFEDLNLEKVNTLFCMEFTGHYNDYLIKTLTTEQCNFCIEMPLKIKNSSGFHRGKNDKIDAKRIAVYALKNVKDLMLYQPVSEALKELKELIGVRARLVKMEKQLKVPIQELKACGNIALSKKIKESCQLSIDSIAKDLKEIEKKMNLLVNSDKELKMYFGLVTSVPGVGKVTAWHLLCATNMFQKYTTGKQLACYVGVAPFEHSSGTSVKGKARVSKMANMDLKKLLTMGTLSIIQHSKESREYYNRKVAEGKNEMLVINAIRNKIVLRVAAVIRKKTKYDPNFSYV